MNIEYLTSLLEETFAGIVLGEGISLRQAEVIDSYGEDPLDRSEPENNVVDNWREIPLSELEKDCISHLDAEGFRYYLPALLIAFVNNYDHHSMRVIGTIHTLDPQKEQNWDFCMSLYSLLNDNQKAAVALFLYHLPNLVELKRTDVKVANRALRNYWSQYLPEENNN